MIKRGSTICFGLEESVVSVLERYSGITLDRYKRIYRLLSPEQVQELHNLSEQEQKRLLGGVLASDL